MVEENQPRAAEYQTMFECGRAHAGGMSVISMSSARSRFFEDTTRTLPPAAACRIRVRVRGTVRVTVRVRVRIRVFLNETTPAAA